MAKSKSKLKSGQRKATRQQLEDLKAAKARGLHSIDLRKPLSSYGRKLAAQFRGMSSGTLGVVTINEPNATEKARVLSYYKEHGLKVVGDKVIVPKINKNDTVRYNPRTKTIKRLTGVPGEKVESAVVYDIKDLRRLRKNESYEVVFRDARGNVSYRRFGTKGAMGMFLQGYPKGGKHKYYSYEIRII